MGIFAVTGAPDLDNPTSGDLCLTPSGRMFLREELRDQVQQRVRVRLQFFRGEWFLNQNAGTPWFQHLLDKGVPDTTIRSVLSQVLLVDGVDSITSLTWSTDPKTRIMSIQFVLKLVDGSTFKSSRFPPFVIAGY